MKKFNPGQFSEKFLHALEVAEQTNPRGGICGLELEWNMLDSTFWPLLTVGSGPDQVSFVDFFRSDILPDNFKPFSQLEVYHWMIEWATRPYYHLLGAIYESRIAEAILINSLAEAGENFGERFYYLHGNILYQPEFNKHCIPGSWHITKRRYLEKCVDLYGASLATAGIHTNLSLPEPLLTWDFVHSPASLENGVGVPVHLDDYKNQVYIKATRMMRAFASIFIATSASTPFRSEYQKGNQVIYLTPYDSVRNLTFPNPILLDAPNLYRSHDDYIQISYDLVRRGIRFGNNNWTPVRARSFVEPVERLVAVTNEQLHGLYAKGLYSASRSDPVEEMARQIEIQNLLARINLPMARVEVRTDEGGHSLEIDIANLTFKYLLLLRFYADPDFAIGFRYDNEDIARARRNEEKASMYGLRAEIEHPLTGKPIDMREFLKWTLDELKELAEALGYWSMLLPLVEMSQGKPNTSEMIRQRLGKGSFDNQEISLDNLIALAEEREQQVKNDIHVISETIQQLDTETEKLGFLMDSARHDFQKNNHVPVQFENKIPLSLQTFYPDKTSEIVDLAQQLIRIPSVTACPIERLGEVNRVADYIHKYINGTGLQFDYYNQAKYPAFWINFPNGYKSPVMLSGHFDVVEPDPDDTQFRSYVEGEYLVGRGSADMKTVVATYLVWMKDQVKIGPPYPPISLMLIGNEENGELEPMGTRHILEDMVTRYSHSPSLLIAGERTGESGRELFGEICNQNRGVVRFLIQASGQRLHSSQMSIGQGRNNKDIIGNILLIRNELIDLFNDELTLVDPSGWKSQYQIPFIRIGTEGVYNVTPDSGSIGIEIRPIPSDNINTLIEKIIELCEIHGLEFKPLVNENGIACSQNNPYYISLIESVQQISGEKPKIGHKLAGTSARFAPNGQGVVWGQSGIGPHSKDERHFIPSILPYYKILDEYSGRLKISAQ